MKPVNALIKLKDISNLTGLHVVVEVWDFSRQKHMENSNSITKQILSIHPILKIPATINSWCINYPTKHRSLPPLALWPWNEINRRKSRILFCHGNFYEWEDRNHHTGCRYGNVLLVTATEHSVPVPARNSGFYHWNAKALVLITRN